MDQTGRSTEREFAILGLNRRSHFTTFRQHCAALKMGPSAHAQTATR